MLKNQSLKGKHCSLQMNSSLLAVSVAHRIGGNRERRVVNNVSLSIAKINVLDCQNRYNGNRKCLFEFVDCLAIENALFGNR